MPVVNIPIRIENAERTKAELSQLARALGEVASSADGAKIQISSFSTGIKNSNSVIKESTANVKKLAAQVIALVGAYKALDTAKGFFQRGIDFASSLEDAQTSIGSIIAATSKISTAQGRTLEGAEKFAASLEISKDVMDQIQVLALESTATFDSLVQGVSGIIAPATKAGIAIEKLPKFAVTAAQAMSTMKIPIEQMRTEIESLLSGNINKAQDLLATNLGITGEMVKNWKAQGVLVEELTRRLEPFAMAGERVANSWSGLKSNMQDALDYMSKVSGEGLFESIKQSYRELLDLIISTDSGKPGISAEFENVVSLLRDIQDAIGNGILDLTRDLIDELKELNKPENIAEIKRSFSEFKDVTVELFGTVKEVAGAVTSFVATSMQGWSNMPDIIQEMGIVGAVLLGRKGRLALLAVGQMDNFVRGLMATASGEMSLADFAALPGGDEGRRILDDLENRRNNAGKVPALASSHGGNEIPSSTGGAYKVTPAISDSGKKASSSSIDNARQKIAELRREIEQMQGNSTKTVSDLAKKFEDIAKAGKSAGLSAEQVSKLQQEYKDAFQAKTLKDFNKELLQAQGNTTALKNIQIEETLRSWTQQFQAAGLTAEQYAPKIEELQNALKEQQEFKDLKVAADFYKELADLSGSYGKSLELQNRLIKEQAKNWERAGIPLEDIAERVRLMVLDLSQDPFDGAYRGLLKFSAEYADSGKQWEKISYSFAGNFQSATREMFDNFLDTGRVSFASLERSFATLLKDMAYQALVQPVVLSIVGGVQQGVYGMTTAGSSGANLLSTGAGLAQQYASSQLFSSMGGSGLLSGVTSGINSFGASLLPGVFAPNATIAAVNAGTATPAQVIAAMQAGHSGVAGLSGATTTVTGLLGAAGLGFGLGSLGGGLLGNLVGLNSGGSSIGGGIGGALGAGIGSIVPGIGTALGGIVGGALGSIVGGLFGGGGDKDPGMSLNAFVDLGGGNVGLPPGWMEYGTTGNGYAVWSGTWEGVSDELNKPGSDALAQIIQQQLEGVSKISEAVDAIGNSSLKAAYEASFAANRTFVIKRHWEDEEINLQEFLESVPGLFQEQMYKVLSGADLSGIAVAADGAIADTMPEVAQAIMDAMSYVALGENLGEYQDDFNAAISGKLLDALNQMDTSGIALDVDKSSLAGWEAAAKALQAWDEVDTALTAILDPASELETTMSAAQGQFDGWLATLRKLGWQEEAVAGIEAKRASVLQSYASSLTRAVEEDLALRSLSLRYGSDSGEYGLRSLQYRQQTELDELRKKLGEDSDLYQTMVQTQQAETTKYRIDLLEKELEDALAAEEQSRARQASAMLSAAKSAEKLRDDMKKIAESFADARRDIWNSPADDLPGSSYLSSLASFDDAYLKALKGDEDALRDLPNLASGLLELGRENLSTSEEYSDLFYDVDRKLKHVQESAQNGLIKGQSAQIDAITSQTGTLQAAINAGTAAGEYTGRSVDSIRAELEALQKLLAQQTAAITSAGSTTRREELLQAKVEQLNKSGYQGRRDWTSTRVQNEMADQNLTVEAWYDRYGKNENLGVKYDSAAARRDLLQRKADAMNAGRTLAGGQEAGGWTADRVEAAIKADGMTVDEWYLRFGRAEGFASGGITPVGRPFWVGERGPELMMGGSPHRVWSHTDSMALVERGRGGWDMTALLENGRGVLRELRSLNSRIARLEKYTRDTSDAVTRASVLGWTVTQEATA